MNPKYSSYEEINRDLKILKVEKELNFHRLFKSFDQLKDGFTPIKLATNAFGSLSSIIKGSGGIQAFLITGVLKFIFKRIFR